MIRKFLAVAALFVVSACSTAEPVWAPDEAVAAARYVHSGPTAVTLFTVVSNTNNSGGHSGLLINGSERVMFDPAGTWHLDRLAERNDVHHGMTERMVAFYIDYHARETYRVVEQTVPVTREVADLLIQRVKANGAVPKAQCANSITGVLEGVAGFEAIKRTWFPNALSKDFATLPGVTTRVVTDDDADKNHGVLIRQKSAIAATE